MKKTLFVVAALSTGSPLLAQQDSIKVLDEAVVTASKFEQKQSQTGKVITVISKEQLERSNGKTLPQLLTEQAGLYIAGAYNAPGSVQTVFMRGASSGRALILMDGIPVNDPSMINNEFDLNLFSIQDIERIEICRGAQSTLYGSDAIAGVINIITIKKDIQKAFNLKTTNSFGNRNTVRNNVQVYGKAKKLTYTTRFAKLRTDGFSSATDRNNASGFDRDGYDGNIINAAVQYQVLPSLSIRSFVQHSQYKADIDAGVFADDKDYTIRNTNFTSGAGLNFKKGIVSVTSNYQYSELGRNYKNDSFYVRPGSTKFERNQYGGRTQYAELYGNVTIAKWLTALAGIDYRWSNMHQDYFSISSFGPYSSKFKDTAMHQTSYYASLFFNAFNKKLNVEIGGRINKHSRYGTNTTYTFNPSYSINDHFRIFGSIASGFKSPSIFQLFDVFSGNPDLKAEKSVNYEGGIQQTHKKISTRIVYFHRNINNGIDYNYVTFKYFNFIKQTVKGLETEIKASPIKNLDLSANYTLLSGKEETQSRKNFTDITYNYLLRRPKNTFNFTAGYQIIPAWYISITGRSVGKRYDTGGYASDDVLMKKYFLLSAYTEYKWKENVKFFIDTQNLAGKKFSDIRGYDAIPFLINGGISFEL